MSITGCCAPWFSCSDPARGCELPVALDNGNKEAAALPATVSETSPGLWNVAAAPGVAFSPSQGTGASRQPVMWVCTAPGLARGDQRVPVLVVSVGLLLQKEMGLGFFSSSFKIAAGDPLSSGKLVLERDY